MGLLYDNLNRLEMSGSMENIEAAACDADLMKFTKEMCIMVSLGNSEVDSLSFGAGMSLGIQYGIRYAAEYGIPDLAKNLIRKIEEA